MNNDEILAALTARYPALIGVENDLRCLHKTVRDCYCRGGKLMVAGNGGSAADAEHIVGELMKGFLKPRPLNGAARERLIAADNVRGELLANGLQGALPAIALTGHAALSTAFSNDCEPRFVFAQQVWGYGREGDVLLLISTSGNAENLLYAAAAAHAKHISVALLTGKTGGKLAGVADISIRVPETETYLVQELHLPVYHALCELLENDFFDA